MLLTRLNGAPPALALTPPTPLSQRERGEKNEELYAFSCLPPLPLGEEGRGGEGFGADSGAIFAED